MSMKTPEAAALDLVARGAILKTYGAAEAGGHLDRHFLVGEFRWVTPDAFFWFTAHGDCLEDGHVLAFDTAAPHGDGSLTFKFQHRPVAVLAPIDAADVADVDDYRIAFSLWRETGPVIRPLIDRCFDRCTREPVGSMDFEAAIIAS